MQSSTKNNLNLPNLKYIYLGLAILGFLWCNYFILRDIFWNNGNDFARWFELTNANNAVGLLGADVLFCGLGFLPFAVVETRRLKIKYWWVPLLSIALAGIGVAIPLFLYFRQEALEKQTP
jgi:Terpene cyclase DEP1